MSKKFQAIWKQGKSSTGVIEIDTPVIALNLRMIDNRLKKAGLRQLSELVQEDSEGQWLTVKEALQAFEDALEYFAENPESLPFSDLVVEDIPIATQAIRALPKTAVLRLMIVK